MMLRRSIIFQIKKDAVTPQEELSQRLMNFFKIKTLLLHASYWPVKVVTLVLECEIVAITGKRTCLRIDIHKNRYLDQIAG
jgi:hypothetical protein